MTWEILERGRWALPAAALGALAFPVLILSALEFEGPFDPRDPSMHIMHNILVQMNVLMFGSALTAAYWKMSLLYAYPATTASLVTWRLAPAMIAMAVETVVWTAALNDLFHLRWPLWGPALFSAVALAAIAAAVWLTERSRWVFVALAVVAVVLGMWFKGRYGGMFSQPVHPWNAVTPTEGLTLLAFAAVVFWIAVVGVARNRRGEPPFSVGLIAWLDRVLDRAPTARVPFRTPSAAQLWFVRRNGVLMPVLVVLALPIGLIIWLFSNRDPQDLVEGWWVFSRALMCIALVGGATLGNVNSAGDVAMGQFLATRPMTTPDMARTVLRTSATSLLLAWAIWAVALLLVYGMLALVGAVPDPWFPPAIDGREIPASFIGSWAILGGFVSILLTGRSQPFIRLFAQLFAAYIVLVVIAKFALTQEAQDLTMRIVATAVGVVILLGTAWAFVAARRRGLVDAPTAWAALSVGAALVIGAVLVFPPGDPVPRSAYALLIGVVALAIAPLAAAPLALAWNRHR